MQKPQPLGPRRPAAGALSTHATIGSLVGLGVGVVLAWRVRTNRVKMFEAFRAAQKPTHVRFADGREESIPDITPLLRPTRLGDIATYTFFSIAGLFLGGETGLITGTSSARRKITTDPERKARVEKVLRYFRVDVLKQQLQMAQEDAGEGGESGAAWNWNI